MRNSIKTLLKEARKGFLGPILLGACIWAFFFFSLPVEVPNPISSNTTLFIVLNYAVLIVGFYLFRNQSINVKTVKVNRDRADKLLKFFSILVFIAALLRYFDLFYFREISFFNSANDNKFNLSKEENFSLVLGLLSMFRLLYFVPYAIYQTSNKKKIYLIITVLFFLIPIVEGFLRGSRRLILEPTLVFFIILILQRGKDLYLNINGKRIIITLVIIVGLFLSSQHILKQRINKPNNYEKALLAAQYNDFLPLTKNAKNYILSQKETFLGSVFTFYCHLGQYINHGVFELDYLTKIEFDPKYGLYNGYIVVKLLNKLKAIDYPLTELGNPAQRITYVTHFGGLYIDFKWFSLLIMFLFGIIQQKSFSLSKKYLALKPIIIIFILINMTMLIFNFFRAQSLVTLLVYFLSLGMFKFLENTIIRTDNKNR